MVDTSVLLTHWPLRTNVFAAVGPDLPVARAGAASVVDCYGALQLTRSQEARFWGARRVENLIADDTFSTVWTLGPNVTKSRVNRIGPYRQRQNVYEFARASGAGYFVLLNSATYMLGQYTSSLWIGGDGKSPIEVQIQRASDSVNVATVRVVPPLDGLTRFGLPAVLSDPSTQYRVVLTGGSGARKIRLSCPQFERTQGQGGVPSEYVPRGSAFDATPWQGANVDGVRYFDYFNPNYLDADGAVTESSIRTMISEDVIKGYLLGPTRANQWYSSRDIAAAQWTLSNVTAGGSMEDTVLLGPLTLRKMQENAAAGMHRVSQVWRGSLPGTITMHGQTVGVQLSVSTHLDVSRVDANRALVIGFVDKNGVEHKATVDVVKRTVLSEAGGSFTYSRPGYPDATDVTYKTHITQIGDLVRVSFTDMCGTGSAIPTGFVGLADISSGAPVESYAGTAGLGMYVGAMQFERTDHGMLYLGDTSASGSTSTGNDQNTPTFPTAAGPYNWTVYCEATTLYDTDSPSKSSWDDIWYGRMGTDNLRWGCAIRPGYYGGAGPEDFVKQPVFDIFAGPNGTGSVAGEFDVANVSHTTPALQTVAWQLALAPTAVDGASNIRMYVGAKRGVLDINGTHVVSKIPVGGSFNIGYRQGAASIGEKCIKNFRIYGAAKTWRQMAAAVAG